MSTTNTNTTNTNTTATQPKPSLMDKVEGFFGIKKAVLPTSSTEPSDNAHVQADAEAQHRAQLVSDLGIPQPVPTAVLSEIESAHGKVPHAHHVVPVEHNSVPVGHVVKDPTLLDKMSTAFHNISHPSSASSSSNTTNTCTAASTTTTAPSDKIPHSALPNQVLADVKSHKGTPEHVHHVDAPKEHSSVPLGHVVADPSLMDKMSAKFQNLTTSHSAASSTSTTTTTTTSTSSINTNDAIPHSALPNQVLADVKSHKGKPENVHHVDAPVEHSSVPLGHVVKDPTLLDKMGAKLKDMTSSNTATTTATTNTSTVKSTDAIPHSALPNQVLADVKSHKGTPEHVHHVAAPVEHSSVPLGHVVADPSLMDKMSAKLKDITSSKPTTTTTTTSSNIATNDAIPHSALPNQVLADVKSHKGKPENVHHVDAPVEHSSVPLGHVVKDPTLLDKMSAKLHDITSSSSNTTAAPAPATTTTVKSTDSIPHSALPNQVLADVKSHNGTPEHVHHVDAPVERTNVQLGHVVKDPTLMDKMSAKLHDLTSSTSTPSTATTSADAIPHSALPNQVLADVKSHKGTPEHVHHVAAPIEHSAVPLGRVVGDVSCLDRATSAAIHVSDSLTGTSAPIQHAANIPTASLNSAVMKDIRQQHGEVPNAHHVQVIEHPAGPLGKVVENSQ